MRKETQSEYAESGFTDEVPPSEDNNQGLSATAIIAVIICATVLIGAVMVYGQSPSDPEKPDMANITTTNGNDPESEATGSEALLKGSTETIASGSPSSTVTIHSDLDTPKESPKHSWSINLISLTNKSYADEHLLALKSAGYAAEITEVTINETNWYRIIIPGFATVDEANAVASKLADKSDYSTNWVSEP